MKIGVLSDTHDQTDRTRVAVALLRSAGAEALVHCGDLASPPIVKECAILPCYFVFGNHDADTVPELRDAATVHGATCLEWGGTMELGGKLLGVAHGHLRTDVRRVTSQRPAYFSLATHISPSTAGTARCDASIPAHCIGPMNLPLLSLTWKVVKLSFCTLTNESTSVALSRGSNGRRRG